jgi:hypothetical protein
VTPVDAIPEVIPGVGYVDDLAVVLFVVKVIRRLRALDPSLVFTAHYDVMERDAARAFLDRSLGFVGAVREAVRTGGTTDLWPLTRAVDAAVGPFPSFTHELAVSVRAHLAEA